MPKRVIDQLSSSDKRSRILTDNTIEPVKFLLKSEPHEFAIQDLLNKPNHESIWDGIRNFEAAKIMKNEMKKGDRAFFYHSSCKEIGIVGIVEIIREAFADPNAFNHNSKYYDSKSTPEKPRWWSMEIKLVEIFEKIVTLKELKSHLPGMMVVKRGRLSISRVTIDESRFISMMERGGDK